jgi:hypothetical protein
MFEYKVVEQKQKSFMTGKMTSSDLEKLINQYAKENWILDRIISGETQAIIGSKDVFLLVFKRNI